jgi:hypothetical protein
MPMQLQKPRKKTVNPPLSHGASRGYYFVCIRLWRRVGALFCLRPTGEGACFTLWRGHPPAMMFLESREQGQVKYLAGHFLRLNWLATRRVFRRWPAKLENGVPPEGNCCLSKDPLQLAATQQRPRVLVSLRLNGDSFRGHLRHFTFNANHPTITLIVEPDLSASVSRNPSYRVVVVVPP